MPQAARRCGDDRKGSRRGAEQLAIAGNPFIFNGFAGWQELRICTEALWDRDTSRQHSGYLEGGTAALCEDGLVGFPAHIGRVVVVHGQQGHEEVGLFQERGGLCAERFWWH